MIFATVGGDKYQFNRLIRAIDLYCAKEKKEAFIQIGSSDYIPSYCLWTRYLTFNQINKLINEATIIISHAGSGSILASIDRGKIPLVVPRLKCYGEAVDDHQLELANKLSSLGLIYPLNLDNLAEEIELAKTKNIAINQPKKFYKEKLIKFLNDNVKESFKS